MMKTNAMLEFIAAMEETNNMYLFIAAMEEKKNLLQERVIKRRKEILKMKRAVENGPHHRFLPPKPLSRQRSSDDCGQERAQKKAKFCRNFPESEPELRPTNGIVFREPYPGSHDFTGKSKPEKKRKRVNPSYIGNLKGRPQPLAEDVRKKIEEKARLAGEEGLEIVLVIQKPLQRSDVLRQQNRVTIPVAQVENKFLTSQQEQDLEEKIGSHYSFLTVPIIEPSGRVHEVNMRRWNVGKRSVSYVLNGDWKHVVEFNQLQKDQVMQLWAFWIHGRLNFAFAVLPGDESAATSKALTVVNDHYPQTGCLIRRRFDEASSSRAPQPSAAGEVVVVDEVENTSSRSEGSKPRWTFDLNMMPDELE